MAQFRGNYIEATIGQNTVAYLQITNSDPPLIVKSNNPGVASADEVFPPRNAFQREFRIIGLCEGHSMLEARDAAGKVWAYTQIIVSKPKYKMFEFISKSPPRAKIYGPYKDEIISETLYGYPAGPINHLKGDYSVIEVDVGQLLPQWKKLFPELRYNADRTGKIVMIGSWSAIAAGDQSIMLRNLYKQGADQILREAQQMMAAGKTEAEAARWAVIARNNLKVAVREKGPAIFKAINEARNNKKYGNKIGPSYEEIRAGLIKGGIPASEVDATLINGVTKTSKGFNKVGPGLKLVGIAGEVVGFVLVATTDSPESLDPLPRSEKDQIEIERVRLRYGIPATANIDTHGHLKSASYLQVDLFDPHVSNEIDQETEEIFWWLGLDVTYHYSGVKWTVPGRSWTK